jgi:predicted MFS family arabinose efflux permease
MMLGVFALVTAEFLPVSLLTPMAADLHISESLAGQAVSTTALLGFTASLLVPGLTHRLDRRLVLMGFSVLLIISNLLVAFAPGFSLLLLGRVLLGIGLGGFWAMSTAIVMRLVPAAHLPRALAITVSGVAAATLVAAPVGSYLGDLMGWRAVFLGAAGLGLLALVIQLATLIHVLARPRVKVGLLAAMLVFGGHITLFTYVRPHLEGSAGADITVVSGILLAFGVASYMGTWLGGMLQPRHAMATMMFAPFAIALAGLGMSHLSGAPILMTFLVIVWGLAFGTVPNSWSHWVARTVPDEAESAGGLLVAAINAAIASGAAAGGLILGHGDTRDVFTAGALVLIAATVLISLRVRPSPGDSENAEAETAIGSVVCSGTH